MTLENQVCSFNLAKRLAELGVKQVSLFNWHSALAKDQPSTVVLGKGYVSRIPAEGENISAFTVAELGEMLKGFHKEGIQLADYFWNGREWGAARVYLSDDGTMESQHNHFALTEADARAKMMIYLLENKLISKL